MDNQNQKNTQTTLTPLKQDSPLQIQSLTLTSILRDKPVPIKGLKESQSEIDVRAAILKIITEKVLTLAPFKQPKPEQMAFFVDMVYSDYTALSLDDLQLCMSNGLKGLYGVKNGEQDNIISFDSEVMLRWLQKYSEEKRIAAMNFNPAPSNQFPRKVDKNRPVKMPQHIREALKNDIGYMFKKKEAKTMVPRINWKMKMPGLTDEEVQIYEYFDDLWNEQHCRLSPAPDNYQIVEVDGKDMTRGEFVIWAKKLINP